MAFNVENFKKELHDLLKKHDVYLGVDITGDTHGIDIEGFQVIETEKDVVHTLCYEEAYLNVNDLK